MKCSECVETFKQAVLDAVAQYAKDGDKGALQKSLDAARDALNDCLAGCE